MSLIAPILGVVSNLLTNNATKISDMSGVERSVVDKVIASTTMYLQKDERIAERLSREMQSARNYDVETFDKTDAVANRLRSIVRPICTFVCLGWYIYARVYEVPLKPEDYAIVGGVLAFWFGFRPFEKRKK